MSDVKKNCKSRKIRKAKHLMLNLKSQMIGQVFIYVLAVILIGFILVFGYNAIVMLQGQTKEVSFVKLKNHLSDTVEIISPDFEGVKIRDFEVPSGYDVVCFVRDFPGFPVLSGTGYPVLEDSVNSAVEVESNAFLVKGKVDIKPFFIGDISVEDENGDDEILCLEPVNNIIKLKFEGRGDHALLSEAKT